MVITKEDESAKTQII